MNCSFRFKLSENFKIALLFMHTQQISLSSSFDLQNGHQNFSMKPEVNENATLSTVNIAINDNHRL